MASRSERAKKARHARLSAQRRGAVVLELIYYDEIYDRDEGICQLCWEPVEFEKGTLDHKHPISKGGPHIKSNVQLSHLRCNNDKGSDLHELSVRSGKGWKTSGSL